MTDTEEETLTAEAFNLCCNWLNYNGHGTLALRFAEFVRGQNNQIERTEAVAEGVRQESIAATLLDITPNPQLLARQSGYTGDMCPKCSSMRMVHTGHCNTCQECGETTGCS